jgi:hypothetical protein
MTQTNTARILRIGAGASYAGDRIEPCADLAARGKLDYLVFETRAERTVALAQLERLRDPERGYNELLDARFYAALPHCRITLCRALASSPTWGLPIRLLSRGAR